MTTSRQLQCSARHHNSASRSRDMVQRAMRATPGLASVGLSGTASVWRCRQASSRFANSSSPSASTAAASSARVDGAGPADRQRPDRNAGRHLHDGIEQIDSRQRLGFHRHPEHGKRGQRRRHPGQMRGAARAGNDDLEARGLRPFGEDGVPLGCAVGGDDPRLVADAQLIEAYRRRASWSPNRTGFP